MSKIVEAQLFLFSLNWKHYSFCQMFTAMCKCRHTHWYAAHSLIYYLLDSINKYKHPIYIYTLCPIFLHYLTLQAPISKGIYFSDATFNWFPSPLLSSPLLPFMLLNRRLSHASQPFCPSTSSPRSWRWELSLQKNQNSSEYFPYTKRGNILIALIKEYDPPSHG